MNIREALAQILTADPTLAGLVSDRIYPMDPNMQNVEAPYLKFIVISKTPLHTHEGRAKLEEFLVQVNVYAKTAVSAGAVSDALQDALDGFHYDQALRADVEIERDLPEDTERGLVLLEVDFRVWFGRS